MAAGAVMGAETLARLSHCISSQESVVDAGASQSPVSSVQGTSCGSHAAHI